MFSTKIISWHKNNDFFAELAGEEFLNKSKYYQIMEEKIKEFKLDQVFPNFKKINILFFSKVYLLSIHKHCILSHFVHNSTAMLP
jgi:hypothetical protein